MYCSGSALNILSNVLSLFCNYFYISESYCLSIEPFKISIADTLALSSSYPSWICFGFFDLLVKTPANISLRENKLDESEVF